MELNMKEMRYYQSSDCSVVKYGRAIA